MADIVSDTDARDALNLDSTDTLLPVVRTLAERACIDFLGYDPTRPSSNYTRYYPHAEVGGHQIATFPGSFGSVGSVGGRSEVMYLEHKYVLASGFQVWESAGSYMGQYSDADWTELTLGTQYALDLYDDNVSRSGKVIRLGASAWPKQVGSVKVSYKAGFTATEFSGALSAATDYTDARAVRLAVFQAIAKLYNEMKGQQKSSSGHAAGAIISERTPGGYQYTLASSAVALKTLGFGLPPEVKELLFPYKRLL